MVSSGYLCKLVLVRMQAPLTCDPAPGSLLHDVTTFTIRKSAHKNSFFNTKRSNMTKNPKYTSCASRCYLFQGCRQKLLDSLLGASTVQLFMPRVEVVTEGDHLHELYIVLAGLVETFKPGVAENAEDISLHMEAGDASHHGDASYHGSMSRYG